MNDSIDELRTHLLRCKNQAMVTLFDSLIIGLRDAVNAAKAERDMLQEILDAIMRAGPVILKEEGKP